MAPDHPPSRRKRTRRQTDDEASPNLTSSTKKRRLNGNPPNSSPSSRTRFSALASAIGGVFGLGRPRDDANEADTPELRSLDDDLPDSGEDELTAEEPVVEKPAVDKPKGSFRPAIKYAKLGINPQDLNKHKVRKVPQSVYDVPDSGDELEIPASAAKATRPARNAQGSTPRKGRPANGAPSAKRASTRARKAAPADGKDEDGLAPGEIDGTETPSGSPARQEKGDRDIVDDHEDAAEEEDATDARASKATTHLEDSARKPPPQKSAMTPRHRKPGRPRKNVAFDNGEDTKSTEVYFADLPFKARATPELSKRGRPSRADKSRVVQEKIDEEEDEDKDEDNGDSEDDQVCVICSKPDSKRSNQIVFCEQCDQGYHQKCYNVPVIPKDDWFCRECLQEGVVPSAEASPDAQAISTPADIPDIPNFERHLQTMQRVLIDRCSGNRPIKISGQDEAYAKTCQLVEQTVLAGEGNSMMIIGARGCGKTTLVNSIISSLAVENKDSFHVVRLNGFIHTDDKLALKEIWRQLGKELDVEDDVTNKTNNYADTLATLLALLSHPSEITGTEEGLTSKSVIFVIDEFDLFATHARQTLLYNLFDIAQARKAPIAVLGLTTRIDVVESLEKRVKSRFSHRYVHLSLPKSLPAYWDICKHGLCVDQDELEAEGFDTTLDGMEEFLQYWNDMVENLRKSQAFQDHLEYHFYASKSVPGFLTSWIMPLSSLTKSCTRLETPSVSSGAVSLEAPDSKLHLLAALSDLDLALLIAAARLDIIAHTDTVNFAMAYDEYSSQMGKQRVQSASSGMLALGGGGRVWGRGLAVTAWERLVSLGLLIPAGIGGRGASAAQGGLEGKMWRLDVALEEIPVAVELPSMLAKWCSQI